MMITSDHWLQRALVTTVFVLVLALVLVAGTGRAEASPPETPNGYVGAWNMINDAAIDHMLEAMANHTAPQGDAGMCIAVERSSGAGC